MKTYMNITSARLLEMKASAAKEGDEVKCDLIDEVINHRNTIQKLDSMGMNQSLVRMVDRYRFYIGHLVQHGTFSGLNSTIRDEINELLKG